ncbi:MAG: class I SAM-dependent methyltransferase [Chloroflexales bacterium]|nr:class I SAM-dependent methyltransferase [Chloroflexales bacterium]
MVHSALWWVGGGSGVAALLYWQIVLAEGAYLGPRAVRLVYQIGARHYDQVRASSQPAADAALRPLLHAALAATARPSILDIATGTGRVPMLLCEDPAFVGQVAALDLTPLMLREARRKARSLCPASEVGWHLAEAGSLPWASAAFDLVTCLEALEYFPRPRRALAEMARVLRPGAALVLSKVPDGWARLLPGRALTRAALSRELGRLSFVDITFSAWQHGHYELVVARRRLA